MRSLHRAGRTALTVCALAAVAHGRVIYVDDDGPADFDRDETVDLRDFALISYDLSTTIGERRHGQLPGR